MSTTRTTAIHRMPIKAASIEAADHLTDHAADHQLRVMANAESPTQLTVSGSLVQLTEFLFGASANGWVTDRSAFTAALSVLTQVAVAA